LDAPTYPPATRFEQPIATSSVISLESFSLAELMKMPAAWAIVVKHLPSLQRMVGTPMIKPHLGNFTVQSVQVFVKTATPGVLAAIDEEPGRLPPVQEAAP
jgi:hypothetical protein